MATAWAHSGGAGMSRRSLLLKMSAALSLASASPVLAEEAADERQFIVSWPTDELSGIWHSQYAYPSTGRGKRFRGDHYIVLRQHGSRLIGQSLSHSTGSRLRLELVVERSVATGTWREQTSPTGYYQGADYHGTLQLVVDSTGRRMRGMWLGFGRDFTINSGEWTLTWCEANSAKSVRQAYCDKV
jgi:hypothetical protein